MEDIATSFWKENNFQEMKGNARKMKKKITDFRNNVYLYIKVTPSDAPIFSDFKMVCYVCISKLVFEK